MNDIHQRYRRLTELCDSLPNNDRIGQECRAALAEIARLRSGLEYIATKGNYDRAEIDYLVIEGQRLLLLPREFARQILEGKS